MSQHESSRRVLLVVNSSWNVINFRAGLIRRLIESGYAVSVATPADGHEAAIRAMGARFIPLPMDARGKSPLRDLRLFWALFSILRREKPAAFLGYTIKPNVYGSIAARLLNIPAVNNVAGLGQMFSGAKLSQRLAELLYRVSFSRSRRVFFQNPNDLDLFTQRRIVAAAKAFLLPGSGIDLSRFHPSQRIAGARPFTFLLVARLLREKGVAEFVEASRLISMGGRTARFAIVGFLDDANPACVSRAEMDDWVRQGLVDYLGESADVREHLRAADCVVLPSYYREGTPRSLLEAAAMGLPIITTDMPGCRDVVIDGESGFLVPPRDAAALAAAMDRMLASSSEEVEAMGKASRALAEARFDETIVVNAYRRALEDLT